MEVTPLNNSYHSFYASILSLPCQRSKYEPRMNFRFLGIRVELWQIDQLRLHRVDIDNILLVRRYKEFLKSIAVNVSAGHATDGLGGSIIGHDHALIEPVTGDSEVGIR